MRFAGAVAATSHGRICIDAARHRRVPTMAVEQYVPNGLAPERGALFKELKARS